MGPEKNLELYDAFARSEVNNLIADLERTRRAEDVLQRLSTEFESMPVPAPVGESAIIGKLFALAQLSNDPMGFIGFSPLAMVGVENNNITIRAAAAPSHDDSDPTGDNGITIHTRVIYFLPPTDEEVGRFSRNGEKQLELEFFGLNIFAKSRQDMTELAPEQESEEPVEITPSSSNDIVMTPAAQKLLEQKLVVPKGDPLLGATNVFAVRHKQHGTVRFYGVTTEPITDPAHIRPPGYTEREAANKVSVSLINGLVAKIEVLEGTLFDQVLAEFESSIAIIQLHKGINEDANFSAVEAQVIRRPSGAKVVEEDTGDNGGQSNQANRTSTT